MLTRPQQQVRALWRRLHPLHPTSRCPPPPRFQGISVQPWWSPISSECDLYIACKLTISPPADPRRTSEDPRGAYLLRLPFSQMFSRLIMDNKPDWLLDTDPIYKKSPSSCASCRGWPLYIIRIKLPQMFDGPAAA